MIRINKKGFGLVEVLASAIILVLISTSVLFALGFSQNMVRENSSSDAFAAEAQAAADVIMTYINGGLTDAGQIQAESIAAGDIYLNANSGFDPGEDRLQFQIEPYEDGSGLYRITVRKYYGFAHDREVEEMICFAHADW